MKICINRPDAPVWVEAEVRGRLATVTGHAGLMPLAPGDEIELAEDGVTAAGLLSTRPLHLVSLEIRTPPARSEDDDEWAAARLVSDQIGEELARHAQHVWHTSTYGWDVAIESLDWFDAFCRESPHVEWYEIIRRADEPITWDDVLNAAARDWPLVMTNGS